MLMGEGCGQSGLHPRALANAEVWRKWRLAPMAVELAVRRLRWFQMVARHPADNAQLLAVWFGDLAFDTAARLEERPVAPATLDERGLIAEGPILGLDSWLATFSCFARWRITRGCEKCGMGV